MQQPKTFVIFKMDKFEPHYICTSSIGTQTFCWNTKLADKFHRYEAEAMVVKLQKQKLQLYYYENICELVKTLA